MAEDRRFYLAEQALNRRYQRMADDKAAAGSGGDDYSFPSLTYPRPMTVYDRPDLVRSLFAALPADGGGGGARPLSSSSTPSRKGFPFPEMSPPLRPAPPTSSTFGANPPDVDDEKPLIPPKDALPANHPAGWRLFLILLSGALPYIVVVLDDTIVATIIPILISEFKQPADIGWYATAYFLPMTVLMPVFGKCYSLWKIKWLFAFSLVVLLAGSIVCGLTNSSLMFIAGRATAGAGAAGIINGAMRLIGVSSPRKERSFLEAAGALLMGGCTVAGPILGGVIADSIGWRWAFLLNIPIAFGALVVVILIFPNEAPKTPLFALPFREKLKRLDPFGSVALIGSLCTLVAFLESRATNLGNLDTQEIVLAVISGVLFGAFLVNEHLVRTEVALIPWPLLRKQSLWACGLLLFFLFAAFINFVFFLSVYFQSVVGETAKESAIHLLPYVVAASIASILVGVGIPLVHYYNPFFILGSLLLVLGSGLVYTFDGQTSALNRSLAEAVLGSGAGFLILANVAPCHIQLDEEDHSVATGFLFLASLLGATLSLPISSAIFNQKLLTDALALDVPLQVKLDVLSDPTDVYSKVPPENIGAVIDVLVESIRQAFLVGVICSILCAMCIGYVPFKRVIVDQEPGSHNLKDETHKKHSKA